MIRAEIYLRRYGWRVHAYIAVHEYYTYEILDRMRRAGAGVRVMDRAYRNLMSGRLDNGITYSNAEMRETVWVTALTSSAQEFFNTIVHEIGHVGQHVGMELGLDPYGEEVCYLMGDMAAGLFPYCKGLLCEHCHCDK